MGASFPENDSGIELQRGSVWRSWACFRLFSCFRRVGFGCRGYVLSSMGHVWKRAGEGREHELQLDHGPDARSFVYGRRWGETQWLCFACGRRWTMQLNNASLFLRVRMQECSVSIAILRTLRRRIIPSFVKKIPLSKRSAACLTGLLCEISRDSACVERFRR